MGRGATEITAFANLDGRVMQRQEMSFSLFGWTKHGKWLVWGRSQTGRLQTKH